MSTHRPSILLVYPSSFHYPDWMERLELKTSQVWLASYLSRWFPVTYADFEVQIGRPNSSVQVRRFERRVRDFLSRTKYDVLAISCWTSLSYQASCTVARISRDLFPDRPIIVGGYHPTARPDDFKTADRLFDYVITGEGELTMKELLQLNGASRPVETRQLAGRAVGNGDFVPYRWDLVSDWVERHFPEGASNIYLYLSRGCPFGCTFCMEPLKDRSWRAFSPTVAADAVFEAAERFRAYGIAISDACFGLRRSWRREFLGELARRNPPFWIVFETRAEYVDDEDIDRLADLKVEVQFGLESGSPSMLRLMNKTRNPQRYLDRFREVSCRLSEHGVLHRANLIFNHPGESEETLRETFAYIDDLIATSDSYLMWACHRYMDFPGCDIDLRRSYYEETYGTRFFAPDWWRQPADQYVASQQMEPSADLSGERSGVWRVMLEARNEAMKQSLAEPAFRFAANKYFLDWKRDLRYVQG